MLDYGSHTFKAGLATNFPNDEEPRVVRPAVAAHCDGEGGFYKSHAI